MAAVDDIANQGLQLLGASQITTLGEGSVNANAMTLVFAPTRDALLRSHIWKFAIKRTSITKHVTSPTFGRANAFDLPSDYLGMLAPYPEDNFEALDWIVEGVQIITDNGSPLDFRYIAQITDPDKMDALFKKAWSAALAIECAELLTQSTSKLENVSKIFAKYISEARQASAFESVNHQPPEDSWISARDRGLDNTRSFY